MGEASKLEQCHLLCSLLVFSHFPHNQIGPFWCWFPGGWVCVRSRTLLVSPMNSPVRLGVSLAAASTPTGVFSQRLWGYISSSWDPGLCGLSCSPVVPPSLCACKCGTARQCWTACFASCQLAESSPSCCLSLPFLPVWMNVSSLTLWLSDFDTVRFSVSSGCFLFLNCCPSFGCVRRHSVSTYVSILAESPVNVFSYKILDKICFVSHSMKGLNKYHLKHCFDYQIM